MLWNGVLPAAVPAEEQSRADELIERLAKKSPEPRSKTGGKN